MILFFFHSPKDITQLRRKINIVHTMNAMGHLFSKSGPQTSSNSITWELARNAHPQIPLQAYRGDVTDPSGDSEHTQVGEPLG